MTTDGSHFVVFDFSFICFLGVENYLDGQEPLASAENETNRERERPFHRSCVQDSTNAMQISSFGA
jgi:hypothetical protein